MSLPCRPLAATPDKVDATAVTCALCVQVEHCPDQYTGFSYLQKFVNGARYAYRAPTYQSHPNAFSQSLNSLELSSALFTFSRNLFEPLNARARCTKSISPSNGSPVSGEIFDLIVECQAQVRKLQSLHIFCLEHSATVSNHGCSLGPGRLNRDEGLE